MGYKGEEFLDVLIYGYGWVGRSLLEFLEDRNAESNGKFNVSVFDENFSPFVRDNRVTRNLDKEVQRVDIIFVCMSDYQKACEIYSKLLKMGFDAKKIKHVSSYSYFNDAKGTLDKYNNDELIKLWKEAPFDNHVFNQLLDSCVCDVDVYYNQEHFFKMKHSLNNDLEKEEKDLMRYYRNYEIQFPILGVSYALGRCGTTLMTQWLASLKIFEYPTNFLKPYLNTPLVGFRNYIYFKKFFGIESQEIEFKSDFGNTRKLFDALEFSCSTLSGKEYENLDCSFLDSKLQGAKSLCAGIVDIVQKPLGVKVSPQDIYIIESFFDRAIYIVLERDIYTHTLALVNLYRNFSFDNSLYYYSRFAHKDVQFDRDPVLYAAITLKNAITYREKILAKVDEKRKIRISYEAFCENPKKLFDQIIVACNSVGYFPDIQYLGVENFTISPRVADKQTIEIVNSVFNSDKYDIFGSDNGIL